MNPIEILKAAWPFLRQVVVADLTAQVLKYAVEHRVSLSSPQAGEIAEAVARYVDSVLGRV